MIKRKIEPVFRECVEQFPVVTILGPRQSGKTTLARETFPGFAYANLESPPVRELARTDPDAFFRRYPCPAIIDEVQRVPELLSSIQVLVDEKKENGMFVLTGSHQPKLKEGISQSLAGRTTLLTLLPLSMEELVDDGRTQERDNCIFTGFMPRLHERKLPPPRVYEDYFRTYVERDVSLIVNIENKIAFEGFVRLLAGRVGQLTNLDGMGGELGVSAATLKKWLSVLEASYIVFRLPAYFKNFGKRIVKTPKVYFTEVGLAAHLIGLDKVSQVGRDPLLGGLFENLVVAEALKARTNAGLSPNLYFLRDQHGTEVDLVSETGRELRFFEIKSGMTPHKEFASSMRTFAKAFPAAVTDVVYSGEDWPLPGGGDFVNFARIAGLFR